MSFEFLPGEIYYRALFTDVLHKKGIIEYYNYLRDEQSLPRKLKILIDTSGCVFTANASDIRELNEAMKEAVKKFEFLEEAIIVTKPYETVIATLFSEANREPNYIFRIFSTEAAADNWLASH
jgi:hypothetical protein